MNMALADVVYRSAAPGVSWNYAATCTAFCKSVHAVPVTVHVYVFFFNKISLKYVLPKISLKKCFSIYL